MDHLSIIIVNYNTAKDTRQCLQSVLETKKNGFKYNIIIIDNGSRDLLKIPKNILIKEVELLRSESNLGFTGGYNLGISHAIKKHQSDYFLLLNSDTRVDSRFLNELYQPLASDPEAGLANPKIYFEKGSEFYPKSYHRSQKGKVLWFAGGSIDWNHLAAFHRGVDEVDRGQFDNQHSSDFATGCCLLIKREVIETVGILDKRFFLYSEDVDFSLRAKKAGFKILFCPQSLIWHKNAASSEGAGSRIHQYYQTRNRLLLSLKHGSIKVKLLVLRLAFHMLREGSPSERQAVFHLMMGRFGKQQIV